MGLEGGGERAKDEKQENERDRVEGGVDYISRGGAEHTQGGRKGWRSGGDAQGINVRA